ncbi:MAG: TetR/AcrR family transcriptional regulator [Sphaerochaeta sp.]
MSKKSKDFIANSLIELMRSNKFDVITISEICDNTQIVRKTFYNNFSSKEDVISYHCKNLIMEYYENVKKGNSGSAKDAARFFFNFGYEYKGELELLLDNNLYHLFGEQFKEILPEVNKLFPKSKVSHMSPEQTQYAFPFMAAGALQLLKDWIERGTPGTPEDLTNLYFYIIHNLQLVYSLD